MFNLAESHLAREPLDISYQTEQNKAITKSTSMRVLLHFTDQAEASRMLVSARKLLQRQYSSDLPFEVQLKSLALKFLQTAMTTSLSLLTVLAGMM